MRLLLLFFSFVYFGFSQGAQVFGLEQNIGQFPPNVLFARRSSNNLFYVTRDAVVLRTGVRMQIAGLDPKVVPVGDSPSSTVYNYHQGRNPSAWRTTFRMFEAVRFR